MMFSTLLSVLPVLALAAPAFASPVAKKRACARPSVSASATVSASASVSASVTVSIGSAASSASASSAEPTSINTGIFAPEGSSSASLEPASSSAAASASASSQAASETASPTSSASAAPAESSSPASTADADLFVKLHNDFRAQYGAPAVEWDEGLAQFARDYAPICKMVHSSGPYGENLAGGAGAGYDVTRAFNSWADEGQYYDYDQPGVLTVTVDNQPMSVGHFTQVVWKATTKIGCAAVTCADGTLFTGYGDSTFVVCEYEAAGNVYLEGNNSTALFVENVGKKA